MFKCISGFTYQQSKIIFIIIIISVMTVCYICTYKKTRTHIDAVINVLLPYGIYTFLALANIYISVSVIIGIITAVLIILSAYKIFSKKINYNTSRKEIIKEKFLKFALAVRMVMAPAVCIIMVITITSITINNNLLTAKIDRSYKDIEDNQWTISNNTEKLCNLKNELWGKLSLNEKLEILKIVSNIESRYLGINQINVGTKPLKKSVVGSYDENTKTISIDTEYLRSCSGMEALNTILHELRHAYQYSAIESLKTVDEKYYKLLMYREVIDFKRGKDEYNSDNVAEYFFNNMEIDSRMYEMEASYEYFAAINEYMEKTIAD